MKNNIIQILFAVFVTGSLLSCHDHDDFLSPQHEEVMLEFDSTQMKVLENEAQRTIKLSFNRKTMQNGTLTLSVSNVDQSRFIMEPEASNSKIIMPVTQNQESVMIKIKPIDNSLREGDFEFIVSISSATEGFVIGERKSVSVKLQDDESLNPPQEVKANFIQSDERLNENDAVGKSYLISLSEKLISPGSIEISLASIKAVYGTHFNTIPFVNNGKVILTPAIGEHETSLTIMPIDDSIISGDFEITLTITSTSGSILKGGELSHSVTIIDDELTNKPKGYESSGGGWSLKKIYEYDETGRIKYLNIDKSTPATSTQKETYFYTTDGRIQKINTYPQIDIVYTWSNDRIIKSETIDNGVVKEYIEYDYDAQGNVSGTANYFKQQNGQFKLGFLNIFLYFLDNNLYKSQTYIPSEGSEELLLISTRTYDHYIDAVNPFPMVEILPNKRTQTKLPSTYVVEENGLTLNYSLSYEFRPDGIVKKRLATQGNSSESTYYLYY